MMMALGSDSSSGLDGYSGGSDGDSMGGDGGGSGDGGGMNHPLSLFFGIFFFPERTQLLFHTNPDF